jgi:hypothetical protein
MVWYALHDLTLEVQTQGQGLEADLAQLLQDLSWVRMPATVGQPSLRLCVHWRSQRCSVPPMAREVLRADGFCGLECGDDFYVTDGSSLLHLQAMMGQGAAYLAPAFFHKPMLLQRNFWAFALLRLLRPLGLFSLHAAGVVDKTGRGVLVVGSSGNGKSTLALGLVRHGWGYLSDDALLLRQRPEGVAAFGLRKHFYVNADTAPAYRDFALGEAVPDAAQGWRRRLDIHATHPEHAVVRCLPQVLIATRIVPQRHSVLQPLGHTGALNHLLAQSGPQLFDRHTMAQHLETLKCLVQQTATYELRAGLDLYHHPGLLEDLLAEAEGREYGAAGD